VKITGTGTSRPRTFHQGKSKSARFAEATSAASLPEYSSLRYCVVQETIRPLLEIAYWFSRGRGGLKDR
jgi:hypothetical protein